MKTQKWSVGDPCFYEYQLAWVDEVEPDGRVTDISTGYTRHGSYDLRDAMIPFCKAAKMVSAETERVDRRIREREGGRVLNWPDLHRKLVSVWVATWERLQADPKTSPYDELYDVEREIVSHLDAARDVVVAGVRLYGRR